MKYKMKRSWIHKMILVAQMLLMLSACNGYLNETPDNRTEIDSETKISEMLVSAYPTTYYALLAELSSDNTDDNGDAYTSLNLLQQQAATWTDITEKGVDSPYNLWSSCYLSVAAANQALQAIEQAGNPTSLNAQRGEALICRAYAHFILTNVFCQAYSSKTSATDLGVPYVTQPETTVSPHYNRGTVAEDYRQMAADIETALPLIDDKSYSIPKYHFNKRAAYAFAARFYLYYAQADKSNFNKVIDYAGKVLTTNASSVIRDWSTVGALSPNDGIRAKAFVNADDRANLMLLSTYSTWARICGPYTVGARYSHNAMIAEFETNQYEQALWGGPDHIYFKFYQFSNMPKVVMDKIPEYFEYTDAVNGIGYTHNIYPAFTTDECLLNRAEAYALTGRYSEAITDINTSLHAFTDDSQTVTAASIAAAYGDYDEASGSGMKYYTPQEPTPKKALNPDFSVSSGEQEQLVQAILHLRRIVSLHEGLRWFDVKRYGMEIYRRRVVSGKISVYDTMKKNDPRWALQLPAMVIAAGMQPNPRN